MKAMVDLLDFRTITLGCALTLASIGTAFAESPCKGLEQDVCIAREDCRWIDGYTRKDGIEVSGYCRAQRKAQPQASTSTQTAPSEGESSSATNSPTPPASS